jgi:hypothetical protein
MISELAQARVLLPSRLPWQCSPDRDRRNKAGDDVRENCAAFILSAPHRSFRARVSNAPKGSAGEQPRQKVWEKVRSNAPAHGIFRSRAALFVGGLRRHPSAKLLAGGPSAAGRSPATAPGRALRTRARRRRSRSASSSLSRNALPANGMEGNIVLDGWRCQGFCRASCLGDVGDFDDAGWHGGLLFQEGNREVSGYFHFLLSSG